MSESVPLTLALGAGSVHQIGIGAVLWWDAIPGEVGLRFPLVMSFLSREMSREVSELGIALARM